MMKTPWASVLVWLAATAAALLLAWATPEDGRAPHLFEPLQVFR
jgi:hypothetical protein